MWNQHQQVWSCQSVLICKCYKKKRAGKERKASVVAENRMKSKSETKVWWNAGYLLLEHWAWSGKDSANLRSDHKMYISNFTYDNRWGVVVVVRKPHARWLFQLDDQLTAHVAAHAYNAQANKFKCMHTYIHIYIHIQYNITTYIYTCIYITIKFIYFTRCVCQFILYFSHYDHKSPQTGS